MAELLPAILTSDEKEFAQKCAMASQFAPMIHVDVTDSSVVPSPSLTVQQIEAMEISVPIELHLMVADPDAVIASINSPRITRVLFHPHASKNPAATLLSIREEDREAGIVLDIDHKEFDLGPVVNLCSQVTILAVAPGFQGSEMDASMLDLARSLRESYPHVAVELDGGIKIENAGLVSAARAKRYVVGSGIWSKPDPGQAYTELMKQLSA